MTWTKSLKQLWSVSRQNCSKDRCRLVGRQISDNFKRTLLWVCGLCRACPADAISMEEGVRGIFIPSKIDLERALGENAFVPVRGRKGRERKKEVSCFAARLSRCPPAHEKFFRAAFFRCLQERPLQEGRCHLTGSLGRKRLSVKACSDY